MATVTAKMLSVKKFDIWKLSGMMESKQSWYLNKLSTKEANPSLNNMYAILLLISFLKLRS